MKSYKYLKIKCSHRRNLFIAITCVYICSCLAVVGCLSKELKRDVVDLGYEKERCTYDAISCLHLKGEKSIPLLINKISDCQSKTFFTLANSRNSQFGGYYECYGFFYAYLIELILGKEKLDEIEDLYLYHGLGAQGNYIYWDGLLVDENEKMADKSNLSEIQEIYAAWWENNKHKSLKQLREDWKNDRGPLSGSRYRWH